MVRIRKTEYDTLITELVLACEKLKNIPLGICTLINLINLNLSFNKIAIIPKEIKYLIELTELYLNCNYISVVPSDA